MVFDSESELLAENGHEVYRYLADNCQIHGLEKIHAACNVIWSLSSQSRLRRVLKNFSPHVVHFHNIFPLISPSAYYACSEYGVPVVQSLHNPRLICPSANLFREGKVCEQCLGRRIPWPGVIHGCYRTSHMQTAAVAAMLTFHRWMKTWERCIDSYIVFTDFYQQKFTAERFSPEKIVVKPHFLHPDPLERVGRSGEYALFIGRVDPEKGISTLLQSWQYLPHIPLKIRGDGYFLKKVRDYVALHGFENIEIVGRLSKEQLIALIKRARFLIWPSEGYYETFGRVVIEAFACGVPVIASNLGVMAELVENGRTGLLFNPGDPRDLADKAAWLWARPMEAARMGRDARAEYEEKYTAERNYRMMMEIYENAIRRARVRYS